MKVASGTKERILYRVKPIAVRVDLRNTKTDIGEQDS